MTRLSCRVCILLLLLLCCALGAQAADEPPAAPAAPAAAAAQALPPVPAEYGASYTPEELAALDTALHAVNMDRTDLEFKKDFAKGYECFPVVREMMAKPLSIAPWMDRFAVEGNAGGGLLPVLKASIKPYAVAGQPSLGFIDSTKLADPTASTTRDELLAALTALASASVATGLPAEQQLRTREFLPYLMDWHDVYPSVAGEEQRKTWEEEDKSAPADAFYKTMEQVDIFGLYAQYTRSFGFPVDKLGRAAGLDLARPAADQRHAVWPHWYRHHGRRRMAWRFRGADRSRRQRPLRQLPHRHGLRRAHAQPAPRP